MPEATSLNWETSVLKVATTLKQKLWEKSRHKRRAKVTTSIAGVETAEWVDKLISSEKTILWQQKNGKNILVTLLGGE